MSSKTPWRDLGNPLMACGHVAQGTMTSKEHPEPVPVCAICMETRIVERPSLEGRKAHCLGHSGAGDGERDSEWGLPFFQHRPDADVDFYYCGCWGWD